MDEVGSDARLQEIASQFSELEYVEAVVLAGSATGGTSDSQSDYDLYVYSRYPVNVCLLPTGDFIRVRKGCLRSRKNCRAFPSQ